MEGINKIDSIQFGLDWVDVYYDSKQSKDIRYCMWRARDTTNFYSGLCYLNYETNTISYPDEVIPKEPTEYEREIIPHFIIVGIETITEEDRECLLIYFIKEHKLRNSRGNERA